MNKNFRKSFGQRIKFLRKELGITQDDLSLESTVSRSHIAMIESGTRDITLSTLFKISRALKTPLYEMFSFDDLDKYMFNIEDYYK